MGEYIQPAQTEPEPKTEIPILIRIVRWPMLIFGIVSFFGAFASVPLGALGSRPDIIALGILQFISGIGLIITAIGLSYMRKWILYFLTAVLIMESINVVHPILSGSGKYLELVSLILPFAFLAYLWSIKDKFR